MFSKTNSTLSGSHPVCDSLCRSQQALSQHSKVGFMGQVKDFFTKIFDTADWPARWHCGSWTDFHGWLYILSDVAIWAAYFAIPFLLFRIINKRRDIPFPKIIWLFIAFILLCGTTHLIDAVIFWWPAYRLSALTRFATAIVSIFTVFALYNILPVVYNLRTLEQLEAEIEERKKAEQDARHHQVMQQSAEELMAKKDEFMSIASHELKTPLTSVKASLQLLEKMVDKNEDVKSMSAFVKKAVKQTDKLSDIINDLLDVTRIQAGKLQLVKTDFNMMEMVIDCVEQFHHSDSKHKVNIEGDGALMVHADVKRIDQVLSNLLSNSFKYSGPNTPINISFEKPENGQVKIAVTDHGMGIPADKVENIFDRFFRVENTAQNFSGVGLGLYISSEIIKRHNGEIGVNSILGDGSTFWFVI